MRWLRPRQLIGSQCSGALVLAKLGLLEGRPACTDLHTKKWVVESGVAVIDQPFYAESNIATAGGCLASQYTARKNVVGIATAVGRSASKSHF